MKSVLVASVLLASVMNAHGKTLGCLATLEIKSANENEAVTITDFRSIELDKNQNGSLPGIIVDSYDNHGISYNYAVFVKNGKIINGSIENEVTQKGLTKNPLFKNSNLSLNSRNLDSQSTLKVDCEIN